MGMYVHAQQPNVKYCDSLIKTGITKIEKKNYIQALELLTEAEGIAKKNNWGNQLFGATVNIGNCYSAMQDYGEALKYYLKAYNIAVKYKYKNHEVSAINNIAIYYTREGEFKKAHDYFKRAYVISKEEKDSVNMGIYTLNLGMVMGEMKNFEQSYVYFKEALRFAEKEPRLSAAANAGIAEIEMDMGHVEKAKKLSLSLLNEIPEKYGNEAAISLQLNVAKGFLKEKKFSEAEKYALSALKNSTDFNRKRKIYAFLSQVYQESNAFALALQYKDSVYEVQQKLNDIKNGRAYESNLVKFEIQDYKNQIEINNATIAKDRKIFYAVTGCITAILLALIFIFRIISMRHRQ
jgi:tetratricopeptide (TPR) repeat protein